MRRPYHPRVVARISSRTFIGRLDEKGVLAATLAASAEGGTPTVLIGGEAGVGKTRLVDELQGMAGGSGVAWGAGGCIAMGEGAIPYAPVAEALHGLLTGLDESVLRDTLGERGGDLVRILPGLADRLPGIEPSASDEWFRARLFEAVILSLEALAARTPVVLVFEDLHWVDAASLDLIAFLARSPRRRRVLLVATYRSDELHRRHPLLPWLAEIGRLPRVERMQLEPLSASDIGAQVESILGTRPRPGLVDEIQRRSSGNPFFIEELLAAEHEGPPRSLPSSLRDVLLGRIARLSDGARSVVDAAAVATEPIDPELIEAVTPDHREAVHGWLHEAIEHHVLAITDRSSGAVAFRHALVQEAVYDRLLPGERVRLHLAFGRALEAGGEPEPAGRASWWAQRAHHAIAARDQRGALVTSVAAGKAAYDVAAFEAAHEHFTRAIELLDASPSPAPKIAEDRVALLELAAEAAGYAGHGERSIALRRAALSALAPTESATRRARLLLDLSQQTTWRDYESTLATTREANALLADGPATALRARAEASLARELGATERWHEALEMSSRAVATAAEAADPSAEALARIRFARSLAAVGRQQEGEAEAERALAVVRRVRDRSIVGIVFVQAARVHEGAGDAKGSAAIYDEGAPLASELGIRDGDFEIVRAWNHFQIGDWETTLRLLAEHERLAPELDSRFHTLSALVDARAGRHESAQAHLAQGVHPDPGTNSMVWAECAIWSGRPTEAAAHANAGLAAITLPYQYETWKGWLFRILARAEADLAVRARRRRRNAEAAGAAARAEATVPELELLNRRPVSYRDRHGGELPASLAIARAEASRAAGRHEPPLWADAADAWEVLGRPFEIAYARWREGEALLGAGRPRSDARDRLSEAWSIAQRLGAAPISDPVEMQASRARIRLTAVSSDAPAPASTDRHTIGSTLTAREREVLGLLCRGASNRQIAESLYITENTAGVHVSNLLGKLDVGSRTEAIAVAFMAGLAQT
jgi:predicted ATPase/DNA-binding CsgD family transcriptional regulator